MSPISFLMLLMVVFHFLFSSLLPEFCCCYCLITNSCPTLLRLYGLYPPGSSVHGISQARILEWAAFLLHPGTEPASLCLLHWRGGFFTPEPSGKPLVLYLITFLSFLPDLENILEESNNNFKTKNSTHFIAPFYYMNV